jgi:endo-1,4-beta-xylanase
MKYRHFPQKTVFVISFFLLMYFIHSASVQHFPIDPRVSLGAAALQPLDPTIVKNFAQQHGITFGAAYGFRDGAIPTIDPRPADLLDRLNPYFNFYQIPLSFSTSETKEGVFSFANTDNLVQYDISKGAVIKGHTAFYPATTPKWISPDTGFTMNKDANGNDLFTPEHLATIMKNHITGVVTHFKEKFPGAMTQWQVTNETTCTDAQVGNPILCDQSTWMKKYIWTAVHKPGSTDSRDYLELAFQWAHEADPSVKLYFTESVNSPGPALDRMYSVVSYLKNKGTPIDGFGMQDHIGLNWPYSANALVSAMDKFSDLGLEVAMTEFDVILAKSAGTGTATNTVALPATEENLAQQGRLYRLFFDACLHAKRCVNFTSFTPWDPVSWLFAHPEIPDPGSFAPGLLDNNFNQKPAYQYLVDEANTYGKRTVPITYPTYLVMDQQAPDAALTMDGGMKLRTSAGMAENFIFPKEVPYTITVSAYGTTTGVTWPTMNITVDGKVEKTVTVDSPVYKNYTVSVPLTVGTHSIGAAFANVNSIRSLVINKIGATYTNIKDIPLGTVDEETLSDNNKLSPGSGNTMSPSSSSPQDAPASISLLGSSTYTLTTGTPWTDPGATAFDTTDGDLTKDITVSGNVDTNTPDDYKILYTVSDSAGNVTNVTRSIIVYTPQTPVSGGIISSPQSVTVTTNQSPNQPISHIIEFHVEQNHVAIPVSSKPTTPPKSSSKPSTSIQVPPKHVVLLPEPSQIVSIEYTLNDKLLHTTKAFPDTWTFDTTTLADDAYVLKTTYYYQDTTTDTSITIFTVKNHRTLIQSMIFGLQQLWGRVIEWF